MIRGLERHYSNDVYIPFSALKPFHQRFEALKKYEAYSRLHHCQERKGDSVYALQNNAAWFAVFSSISAEFEVIYVGIW